MGKIYNELLAQERVNRFRNGRTLNECIADGEPDALRWYSREPEQRAEPERKVIYEHTDMSVADHRRLDQLDRELLSIKKTLGMLPNQIKANSPTGRVDVTDNVIQSRTKRA